MLASRYSFIDSRFSWDMSVVERLEFRIEISSERADTLLEVAFNESIYECSHREKAEICGAVDCCTIVSGHTSTPNHSEYLSTRAKQSSTIDKDIITPLASHTE